MNVNACTIETDEDREDWLALADGDSHFVLADGTPWIVYQSVDGDWYAVRPPLEDDADPHAGLVVDFESLALPLTVIAAAVPNDDESAAPARTITTVSELDALPVGNVVLDLRGHAWQRLKNDMWQSGWYRFEADMLIEHAPLTVLHDPSAPVVSVVSDAADEEAYQRGFQDGFWNGKTTDMNPAQVAAFMAPYRARDLSLDKRLAPLHPLGDKWKVGARVESVFRPGPYGPEETRPGTVDRIDRTYGYHESLVVRFDDGEVRDINPDVMRHIRTEA